MLYKNVLEQQKQESEDSGLWEALKSTGKQKPIQKQMPNSN